MRGRNLVILGAASIMVAVATTSVSLAIYHNSGDIYLDRSRPGFLPDEEEIDEDEDKVEQVYDFASDGSVTAEGLEEYLKNLGLEIDAVDSYEKPFGAEVLSDEHLGITEKAESVGANGEVAPESGENELNE